MASSPAKQAEQHGERPGCLEGEKGRSGKPTETVGRLGGVESWAVWGPDPDSPGLGGQVGCARGQALPCMEQQD